jgi:hypothetical protein
MQICILRFKSDQWIISGDTMEVDARIDSSLGDRDCAFLRKLGILYDAN